MPEVPMPELTGGLPPTEQLVSPPSPTQSSQVSAYARCAKPADFYRTFYRCARNYLAEPHLVKRARTSSDVIDALATIIKRDPWQG